LHLIAAESVTGMGNRCKQSWIPLFPLPSFPPSFASRQSEATRQIDADAGSMRSAYLSLQESNPTVFSLSQGAFSFPFSIIHQAFLYHSSSFYPENQESKYLT